LKSQIESVLKQSLPDYVKLPKSDREFLQASILLYIFRIIDGTQLALDVREVNAEFSPKKVRLALLSNGVILKNIKLFTYYSSQFQGIPAELFNVNDMDEDIIIRELEDKLLRSGLRKLVRAGYKPLTLQQMSKLVDEVVTEVDLYTTKFVQRKLRFVYEMNGQTMTDIKQDLLGWGIYALYRAFPKIDSQLHAVNIAKQSIHNRGINLIMESTSQSRQRLQKKEDGTFVSKNLPLQYLLTPTGSNEPLTQCNHMIVSMGGGSANDLTLANIHDNYDLKISVRSFYTKLNPRWRRLLKIWSGVYDKEFSAHLGIDNDEWIDKVDRSEYLVKSSRFLKFQDDAAKRFFVYLKKHFAAYNKMKQPKEFASVKHTDNASVRL